MHENGTVAVPSVVSLNGERQDLAVSSFLSVCHFWSCSQPQNLVRLCPPLVKMLSRKNLDELSTHSRDFYERAYMKLNLSLVFGAFGMFFLGLTSAAGAISSSNSYTYSYLDSINLTDDHMMTAVQGQMSGYGFACFVFICATIFCFAMAIYLSPFVGSKNEGNILRTPQDITEVGGDSKHDSNRPSSSIPVAVAYEANNSSSDYSNRENPMKEKSEEPMV